MLNTGRIRDQWHTMTRTGVAPRLIAHTPEPYVDMHAQDALLSGVREGELVRVSTRWGSLVARLRLSGEMPRGMIFVPIHWSRDVCVGRARGRARESGRRSDFRRTRIQAHARARGSVRRELAGLR